MLAGDEQRESRQVGIIDMTGHTEAHIGHQNNAWAGSRQGKTYTTQANIMVGPEVLDAVAADTRKKSAEYPRDLSSFDEVTIVAVDTFRNEHNLNVQGNPAGLADPRLIDALRAGYFARKKAASR